MTAESTQKTKSTYYWASWKRVMMVVLPLGILMMIGGYVSNGIHTIYDFVRSLVIVGCATIFMAVVIGTTFFRIKNNRLYYTSSLFEWHSMDISDIEAITLIPRFFFTNKVTAVQIEKRNHGLFPGMLISRDAFPDEIIVALVNHLKRINPAITLDDGVQKILESQQS
jgi:hypothetical protein